MCGGIRIKMNRYKLHSILKSDVIKKVWLNKKDYKYLDFEFKIEDEKKDIWLNRGFFRIAVYNCGILILKFNVFEQDTDNRGRNIKEREERFMFNVEYFNPQTDNDCYSINHIIAVSSENTLSNKKHEDIGNADILKNQFIFRRRKNFYSYVRIWTKGKIEEDNYDKQLSYEFATDEYMSYIKNLFEIKRLQRRTIKKEFKGYLDKILLLEELKKTEKKK